MTQDALDFFVGSEPSRIGLRDRVLLLRSVENFLGLDEDAITRLAEHARHRAYRKGDVITEEGAEQESIHIVVAGEVSLILKNGVQTMSPGGGFGVLSAMAYAKSRRAVAAADTRTLEVPVPAFRVAMEENFSLLRNALRMIGQTMLQKRGSLPAEPAHPPSVDPGVRFERAKTLAERLVELREGPFESMNLDALIDMARRMIECRFPAGHDFWAAGDPSTYSFHVDYGRVHCTAADGSTMDVGNNFTLGVMDVFASQPRSYAARAVTDIIGYRISYEDFSIILEMHPQVGLELLRSFSRVLLETV